MTGKEVIERVEELLKEKNQNKKWNERYNYMAHSYPHECLRIYVYPDYDINNGLNTSNYMLVCADNPDVIPVFLYGHLYGYRSVDEAVKLLLKEE